MKHQKKSCDKCVFFSGVTCTRFNLPAKRIAELFKNEFGDCKHYKTKSRDKARNTNEYTVFIVTDFQNRLVGEYNKEDLLKFIGIGFPAIQEHMRNNTRCKGLYYIKVKEYKNDIP